MDFGLGKPPAPGMGSDDTSSPTSPLETNSGTVLGTRLYVPGAGALPARRPTLLYEMLAGRRAFQGDTAAETTTAILREEPPSLPATGRQVPPNLDRIVRHCLEKDPAQRFQSASDLAFDLAAAQRLSAGAAAALPSVAAAGARGPCVCSPWPLYFASDRGGAMNLWRIPIDERRPAASSAKPSR